MRMRNRLLAALALVASIGSLANATVTFSTIRIPNANLPGYDTVQLFALNNGAGIDAGDTGLVSVNVTITDNTSPGLLMGIYYKSSGSQKGYTGDPTGSLMGTSNNWSAGNTVPVYGGNNYPGDSSLSGVELYSWVGAAQNGTLNALGSTTPAILSPATTAALTGFDSPLTSFNVQGGWTNEIKAGPTAGLDNGDGAFIAAAVVPTGDVVNFSGSVGTGQSGTPLRPFNLTNPTAVPEPASLGVLALGVVGLIARRRK